MAIAGWGSRQSVELPASLIPEPEFLHAVALCIPIFGDIAVAVKKCNVCIPARHPGVGVRILSRVSGAALRRFACVYGPNSYSVTLTVRTNFDVEEKYASDGFHFARDGFGLGLCTTDRRPH